MKVQLTIQDPAGIHARPAARLAIKIGQIGATVTLHHQGRTADARSVIQLLSLGVLGGSTVQADIQGTPEQIQQVLQELQRWANSS